MTQVARPVTQVARPVAQVARVGVYVLNWNGRPFLEACLSALQAQTYRDFSVTLIDNGSGDDSVAFVRERFPAVDVRENGRNLGFAAGNNAALREAAEDILVLLNPDVVASPGWLAALAQTLEADATIGIAGSKLWYPDGRTLQHAGGLISRPQAMPGHYGIGEADTGAHDQPRDVDYVIGGAVAIRRELTERIGLLDEGFFLYFEDADYCFRARRAGYRVVYAPEATAVHVESAVAVKGSFAYLARFHAGRWRFLLKHFPAAALLDETAPAEADWLERVELAERRAAALAYEQIIRELPEALAARGRDTGDTLDAETAARLQAMLSTLRQQAWAVPGPFVAALPAAALPDIPFRSDAPIVGPLITAGRTAWHAVAGRTYLDSLRRQQSAFNHELQRQLADYEQLIREQSAAVGEGAAIQLMLRRELELLRATADEAEARYQALWLRAAATKSP